MLVCMLAIVLTTAVAEAAGLTSGKWSIVKSPNVGSSSNSLSSVVAVSASNIWAVGSNYNKRGIQQTLIEQWNGTSWKVIPSPNVGSISNSLSSVAAVSANDSWAVGAYANSNFVVQTLIERWNGTS